MGGAIETAQRVYELLAAGGPSAAIGLTTDDVELDMTGLYPDGPVLRGREQVLRFPEYSPWETLRFEVESLQEAPQDRVVAHVRLVVKGAGSGIETEMRIAHVLTVRDGLVARAELHADRAAARAALGLSHLDESGAARMVDVGAKPETDRRALARTAVRMAPATAATVAAGDAPKGDVVSTARIAGIQAAKRTAELVPLCHPLPLSFVDVRIAVDTDRGEVAIEAEARTTARTGVEMEAMTACAVAALTVYDMVKGVERGVQITDLRLVEKTGGREDWCEPQS